MDSYQNRKWVIIITIIIIGFVFTFRLLFLQVLDDKWKERANDISQAKKVIQPPRGLIYDRNNNLLVAAEQVYDIFIIPKDIQESDSIKICKVFKITIQQLRDKIKLACSGYNVSYKESIFIESMSKEEYSHIAIKIKQIPGFIARRNTKRGYPQKIAAHILGYIRKISKKQYEQQRLNEETNYSINDYIGITGIEKIYERELKGDRGKIIYLKDYAGNSKEIIDEELSEPGKNLYLTIDSELQAIGEKLMQNKIGSIVAIEPSSGEILAMVSAPTFNPELLSGIFFSSYYKILSNNDSLKPLINRPIYNDSYRPGSIFKLVQSLIALQDGLINKNTGFICNKQIIGCHNHVPPSNISIAIKHSCNPYFYQVYKKLILRGFESNIFLDSRIGLEKWRESVSKFGFGIKLETDIPGVKTGRIPSTNFYDSWYGKNRWAFSTIYSNSIGEGEIGVSPLQMANLAAIIANRGYYYTPHFIKKIGETGNIRQEFKIKHNTGVDDKHFLSVINAMEQVVKSGTGTAAQIDSINVCGKTGTVENKTFNDHSVFIAFAPKENPKIAIAVYVEYGKWGGTWAAPISSVMIEKYLKDNLSKRGEFKKTKIEKAIILNKHSDFSF